MPGYSNQALDFVRKHPLLSALTTIVLGSGVVFSIVDSSNNPVFRCYTGTGCVVSGPLTVDGVVISTGSTVTQSQADGRYLRLSGGTVTGATVIDLQGATTGIGLKLLETGSASTLTAGGGRTRLTFSGWTVFNNMAYLWPTKAGSGKFLTTTSGGTLSWATVTQGSEGGGDSTVDGTFGDCSDGNVTISSNTSLSRDMYYDSLTINNTFTLSPNGYRIFVCDTLTLNGTGDRIAEDGGNGADGGDAAGTTPGTGGAAGAVAHGTGSLPASFAGRAGGNGANTLGSGVAGSPGQNSPYSIGVGGSKGGGGLNDSQPGGGSGTIVNIAKVRGSVGARIYGDWFSATFRMFTGSAGSGSGGGGDGGSSGAGGAGGGSGATGGNVYVAAQTIVGTGDISADGGDGGDGGDATGNSGAGGGGAGGPGGVCTLIYEDKSSWSGTCTVNGGTGGIGGADSGSDGKPGANGKTGSLLEFDI